MRNLNRQRLFEVMEKVNPDIKVIKPKFIIPVGISGSGMSYWIKRNTDSNTVVVSPDEIRKELTGDISNQTKNKEVFNLAFQRTINALNNNKNVIFDATNVSSYHRKQMLDTLKQKVNKDFIAQAKIFNIDPEIAKSRIKKNIEAGHDRPNVPDFVVDRQYSGFLSDLNKLESDGYEIIN